jgi:hypothetical protein
MLNRAPGLAFIRAPLARARPGLRAGAKFVVQPELAVPGVKQHWIPTWHVWLPCQFYGSAPFGAGPGRSPDRHVRLALCRSSEPRRHQVAVLQFHDGRSVARRKRRGARGEDGFLQGFRGGA